MHVHKSNLIWLTLLLSIIVPEFKIKTIKVIVIYFNMDSIILSLQQLKLSENVERAAPLQKNITKTDIINISFRLWHENQQLKNEIQRLQGIIFQTNEPNIPTWIT